MQCSTRNVFYRVGTVMMLARFKNALHATRFQRRDRPHPLNPERYIRDR
jgi:hypothetical protein